MHKLCELNPIGADPDFSSGEAKAGLQQPINTETAFQKRKI